MADVKITEASSLTIKSLEQGIHVKVGVLRDFVAALDAHRVADHVQVGHLSKDGHLTGLSVHLSKERTYTPDPPARPESGPETTETTNG